MLELVVVLTILGISAGMVVMRPGTGAGASPDDALARARRLAVSRAEVLRFDVRGDGAWIVLSPDGTTLDRGRDGGTARAVVLDALGNCHPVRGAEAPPASDAFDPLTCRSRAVGP